MLCFIPVMESDNCIILLLFFIYYSLAFCAAIYTTLRMFWTLSMWLQKSLFLLRTEVVCCPSASDQTISINMVWKQTQVDAIMVNFGCFSIYFWVEFCWAAVWDFLGHSVTRRYFQLCKWCMFWPDISGLFVSPDLSQSMSFYWLEYVKKPGSCFTSLLTSFLRKIKTENTGWPEQNCHVVHCWNSAGRLHHLTQFELHSIFYCSLQKP